VRQRWDLFKSYAREDQEEVAEPLSIRQALNQAAIRFRSAVPATEFLHRVRLPVRRHGHKVTLIAHVNPAGIRMDNRQARIVVSQTPSQISPLLPIHRTAAQSLERRLLLLRHVKLLSSEIRPRLGSACEKVTDSSAGRASPFQGRPAINQCIAAAEVMLFYGHSGTNPLTTIACRPDL
jgi:hypothetical protein